MRGSVQAVDILEAEMGSPVGAARRCFIASSGACYTLAGSLEWVGRLLVARFQTSVWDVVARGKSEHRRARNVQTAGGGAPTTGATENNPADGLIRRKLDRAQVMGETVGPQGLM